MADFRDRASFGHHSSIPRPTSCAASSLGAAISPGSPEVISDGASGRRPVLGSGPRSRSTGPRARALVPTCGLCEPMHKLDCPLTLSSAELRRKNDGVARVHSRLGGIKMTRMTKQATARIGGILAGAGVLFVGGVLIASSPALADNGPHITNKGTTAIGSGPDGCAGCHRIHSAKSDDGMLLVNTSEEALCTSCHESGAGATTDVINGVQYTTPTGGVLHEPPAGPARRRLRQRPHRLRLGDARLPGGGPVQDRQHPEPRPGRDRRPGHDLAARPRHAGDHVGQRAPSARRATSARRASPSSAAPAMTRTATATSASSSRSAASARRPSRRPRPSPAQSPSPTRSTPASSSGR